MSTSEPAPADARIRPELPDDPTIWEVDDALWARLAPLLVNDKPRQKPGQPRRDDRALLNGLIWLARTGAHRRAGGRAPGAVWPEVHAACPLPGVGGARSLCPIVGGPVGGVRRPARARLAMARRRWVPGPG